MALSTQIGLFLAVAAVYIGFVFVWAWYKGRQDAGENGSGPRERGSTGRGNGGGD